MADEIQPNIQPPRPEAPVDSPIAQELMPRRFKNWIVSDRELNTLGFMTIGGTALSTFLGIFSGAALALGLTWKTVDIPYGKTYLVIVSGFISSLSLSIIVAFFFVLTVIKTFGDVKTIKAESIQEQRRRDLLKEV